mmetsp:Transcript_13000/g.29978  ORF Transcript_13000/g.29978 Transcript_13000/m.29978 type:complete len:249 (+) Transcript_13000:400-1146(+)
MARDGLERNQTRESIPVLSDHHHIAQCLDVRTEEVLNHGGLHQDSRLVAHCSHAPGRVVDGRAERVDLGKGNHGVKLLRELWRFLVILLVEGLENLEVAVHDVAAAHLLQGTQLAVLHSEVRREDGELLHWDRAVLVSLNDAFVEEVLEGLILCCILDRTDVDVALTSESSHLGHETVRARHSLERQQAGQVLHAVSHEHAVAQHRQFGAHEGLDCQGHDQLHAGRLPGLRHKGLLLHAQDFDKASSV